jgi:CRP-like cAMP-binding protein
MSIYSSSRNPVGNRLLAALPQDEYERLLPKLEPVTLSLRQTLYEPNEPIKYVYFPNNAVASLLTLLEDGQTIEAATVGKEGMIGVPLLLGTNQIALHALIQISRYGLWANVP